MAAADDADGEKLSDVDKRGGTQSHTVILNRCFYLKNIGTRDLVMDVKGMSLSGSSPVILWDRKFITDHHPGMLLNQLWYEDAATSTIRTALNGFCLDLYGQSHGCSVTCFLLDHLCHQGLECFESIC